MPHAQQKINNVLRIINTAIDVIPQEYFRVLTIYNQSGIVRERVFCYELYHRMRKIQESDYEENSFTLHAEIDKRGNPEFCDDDQKNPDFIFHIPGEMQNNAIVFEVKGKFNIDDTLKDLHTLHEFTTEYQYKNGLYLFYNYSKIEVIRNLCRNKSSVACYQGNEKISILCKKRYGEPREEFKLSELEL